MSDQQFSLNHDFPEADQSQWEALVEKTLKGAPAGKVLSRSLATGVDGPSFVPPTDRSTGHAVEGMREGAWDMAVHSGLYGSGQTNAGLMAELEGGSSSLMLGGSDLDLNAILSGVMLDLAGVRLDPRHTDDKSREALAEILQAAPEPCAPSNLGYDPIGDSLHKRIDQTTVTEAVAGAIAVATPVLEAHPSLAVFAVDGRLYHGGGGTAVQELAFILCHAVTFLRAMVAADIPAERAVTALELWVSADADVLGTLAKIRSLRALWAQVCAHLSVTGVDTRIVALSSYRMLARADEPVNILRLTTAAFAAGLGGADAIILSPHDALTAGANSKSNRLARNIHTMLQEESGLSKVTDPGSGAEQIEALTDTLTKSAWALFQWVERQGGLLAIIENGVLYRALEESRVARTKLLSSRKIGITGVSEFPNLDEDYKSFAAHAEVEPDFITHRDAYSFEWYRDQSNRILTETGARPFVTAITLGGEADHAPRLNFITNLMASIGFAVRPIDIESLDSVPEGSLATIFCGSDTLYQDPDVSLNTFIQACTDANPLWIAGRPSNLEDLMKGGVDKCIAVGVDCLALAAELYGEGEGS